MTPMTPPLVDSSRPVTLQPLMGLAEVAEYLGVSRQTLQHWLKRTGLFFPEPVARLEMGPVWKTEDIVEWRKKWTEKPEAPFGE